MTATVSSQTSSTTTALYDNLDAFVVLSTAWLEYTTTVPWVWPHPSVTEVLLAASTAGVYQLAHPPLDYRRPHTRVYASRRQRHRHANNKPVYDAVAARTYYQAHPLLVARRTAQLLRLSGVFWARLAWDVYIAQSEEEHRDQHAADLLEIITVRGVRICLQIDCTVTGWGRHFHMVHVILLTLVSSRCPQKMGPTAIKMGQALSVRSDILPEQYAAALATLQDRVPPFDHAHALRILRQELGPERFARLRDISPQPVASASIGQGKR